MCLGLVACGDGDPEDGGVDAASVVDAGAADGGEMDADLDAGGMDGAVLDGAVLDAAVLDAAVLDGAVLDGAVLDGAVADGAVLDGAPADGSAVDAGGMDAAPADAGFDAGGVDAGFDGGVDAGAAVTCTEPGLTTETIRDTASSGTPDTYFRSVRPGDPFCAEITGGGSGTWSVVVSNGTSSGVYCTGVSRCTIRVPAATPTLLVTAVTTGIGAYTLTIRRIPP